MIDDKPKNDYQNEKTQMKWQDCAIPGIFLEIIEYIENKKCLNR